MSKTVNSTRRQLLLSGGVVAGSAALVACNPPASAPATETPTPSPAAVSYEVAPSEADLQARPAPTGGEDYPPFVEEQRGDENIESERAWIDPALTLGLTHGTASRATYEPRLPSFGDRLLEIAAQFVGQSRDSHPAEIEKMLRLYNWGLRDSSGRVIPFCAAGVSYCAALAYRLRQDAQATPTTDSLKFLMGDIEHHHFYPSASVQDMTFVAKGKRQWREEAASVTPRAGWLAVFDFGVGRPSHVAIVETASASALNTIEFNTRPQSSTDTSSQGQRNGGAIARRERPRNRLLLGYIATTLTPPWR